MAIVIRALESRDIPAAASTIRQMWRLHVERGRLFDAEKFDALPLEQSLNAYARDEQWLVYVAEEDGNLAGVVMAEIQKTPEYFREEKQLFIGDIAVEDAFRRRGIGGRLVEECAAEARRRGVNLLCADIHHWNGPSAALFRRMGFEPDITYWYRMISGSDAGSR